MKVTSRFAALANGTGIHSDDYDDTQLAVQKDRVYGLLTHPTAPCLPSAFAEGELKKITLDNALLKESKEIVEDLIVAAHNDAKSKLKKKTTEEISKITGGIDLPPGFKLPF